MNKPVLTYVLLHFAFSLIFRNGAAQVKENREALNENQSGSITKIVVHKMDESIGKYPATGRIVRHVDSGDLLPGDNTVATKSVPYMPLFEEFTSSTCPPCANFNLNYFNAFVAGHTSEFVLIKYQMNWPSPGDPYYTAEGGTRRYYYGVNGVPGLIIGGSKVEISSTAINDGLATMKNKQAFVTLSSTHTVNQTSGKIVVQVDVTPYFNASGNQLYVAVVERKTTGNIQTNGETEFRSVMMKMIPDANGTSIDFIQDVRRTFNFSADLGSTHVEEYSDLDLVVFIQNISTKEVLQSCRSMDITTRAETIAGEDTDVLVYPNPTRGILNFRGIKASLVKIYDMLGKQVMVTRWVDPGTKTDISHLPRGIYFIEIVAKDRHFMKKIVLE